MARIARLLALALALAGLVATSTAATLCAPNEPTFCATAADRSNGFVEITLTIVKQNISWIALGVMSDNATMPGTDIHMAWAGANGTVIVSDRKAVAYQMPLPDASQDITAVASSSSYNATSGNFTVVFRRLYLTGDALDNDLKRGANNFALVYRLGTPPNASFDAPIMKHSFHDVLTNVTLVDFAPSVDPVCVPLAAAATPSTSTATTRAAAPPSSSYGGYRKRAVCPPGTGPASAPAPAPSSKPGASVSRVSVVWSALTAVVALGVGSVLA
ncbi:hypothetical protein M427DRAFT_73436 [Gonapodya prolifera JEL478]|uniref:DOMON domain-containing protein n=1 Tax=Gonapodya prolifera (strain JEL478) TaxID=1344416 RepID=A0A139A244_GONPJ|nr:hypothetical protein M427DRAFT_73436 [Gonapodya prolifera JEL478]|eukprot:KXS10847.1 hypothetical protein M427DRAFT_73436 [Gonapodya prolifera JEL478]